MDKASRKKYEDIVSALERPLLYTMPWWLDATCGNERWDAAFISADDGSTRAAIPFHHSRIRGLSAVVTPPLTQWVTAVQISIIDPPVPVMSLLPLLPKSDILDLSVRPDSSIMPQDPSLPVQLKYSFVIPGTEPMDHVRDGYNEGLRRNLRQAEKNYLVEESSDLTSFLSLCSATYQYRKMNPPRWLNTVVPGVFDALLRHQCGSLTIAFDQGKIVAGILIAWDHHTSYYLTGGRTGDDRGASAHALLLDRAIAEATLHHRAFDFEGSMHPGIANFFQSFGADPVSYWQIRRFSGMGRFWSIFH